MSSAETTTMAVDHIPDHEGGIRFTPPLYRQRYTFALDLINRDSTLRSVLDIGCGTCQLFTVGKYTNSHTELAVAIDIVRYEIDEACFRLKPLPVEYVIFRRQTPLHMYLLHGDATKVCRCFRDFDVVTLIEVVEHLHAPDLNNLVEHVFGHMQPRVVLVTTPNADFNVLFPAMASGQFRHADHKFEFTRAEFQSWSHRIALMHNYDVRFDGLGEAPRHEQHRNLGSCTQIALFTRAHPKSDAIVLTSNEFGQRVAACDQHELVSVIDYPYGIEKPNDVHDQVRYILEMYRLLAEETARQGDDRHDTFPLTVTCQALLTHPRLSDFKLTIDDLKHVIDSTDYKRLDDDRIILSDDPSTKWHEDDHDHGYDEDSAHTSIEASHSHIDDEECWD